MGKAAKWLRAVKEPVEQLLTDSRLPDGIGGELRTAVDQLLLAAETIIDGLHAKYQEAHADRLRFAKGVIDGVELHNRIVSPTAAAAAMTSKN